jgi:hypothetical protein
MTIVKKVPKFNGKKNKFAIWSAQAKVYLAMKFLGPTLLASFKDSLPANEQVELDLNKPNESAKNRCKAMNLHAMNWKPSDQVVKAEQTSKMLGLKLMKGGDPSELELMIASTEALYHQKCKARWYLWGIKYHPAMSW